MKNKQIATIIHWSFTAFLFFYVITGFGITEYRIVQTITFGLIKKPLAFQLHRLLIYPFIILLILHILFSIKQKWWKRLIT